MASDSFDRLIAERRAFRERLDRADGAIGRYDKLAREARGDHVPPIEASAEDLTLHRQANITVSVEWLAFMFEWLDHLPHESHPADVD